MAAQPRGKRSKHRAVKVGRREIDGGFEILVECSDETTSIVVLNPSGAFPEGLTLTDEFRRLLAEEHFGRCDSCQRWAKRVA